MSMRCPKCKGKAECYDSRQRPDNTTSRRYRCKAKKCEASWSTVEVLVRMGDGQPGLPLRKAYEQKVKKEGEAEMAQRLRELLSL